MAVKRIMSLSSFNQLQFADYLAGYIPGTEFCFSFTLWYPWGARRRGLQDQVDVGELRATLMGKIHWDGESNVPDPVEAASMFTKLAYAFSCCAIIENSLCVGVLHSDAADKEAEKFFSLDDDEDEPDQMEFLNKDGILLLNALKEANYSAVYEWILEHSRRTIN